MNLYPHEASSHCQPQKIAGRYIHIRILCEQAPVNPKNLADFPKLLQPPPALEVKHGHQILNNILRDR